MYWKLIFFSRESESNATWAFKKLVCCKNTWFWSILLYISNIFHKTKDNSPSILSISLADTELYFHEEARPVVLCPSESESRQPVALDTPRYPDKSVSVWDHAGWQGDPCGSPGATEEPPDHPAVWNLLPGWWNLYKGRYSFILFIHPIRYFWNISIIWDQLWIECYYSLPF